MIFLTIKKKYTRFREKSMFLNLTNCFTLTFSQRYLVNLGVKIYSKMPEII